MCVQTKNPKLIQGISGFVFPCVGGCVRCHWSWQLTQDQFPPWPLTTPNHYVTWHWISSSTFMLFLLITCCLYTVQLSLSSPTGPILFLSAIVIRQMNLLTVCVLYILVQKKPKDVARLPQFYWPQWHDVTCRLVRCKGYGLKFTLW